MKRLWLILGCLLILWTSAGAEPARRVLMMVPDDFMWPEYALPRRCYEKAGFRVSVAGKSAAPIRPDARNFKAYAEAAPLAPDLSFEAVKVNDYDAITFVGGNGAWHDFFPNAAAHRVLKDAMQSQRLVGLICASTGLLGLVDNLDGEGRPLAEGKRVVGYFRVAGILKLLGRVDYQDGGVQEVGVVRDGLLITGRNPESSQLFGETVVEALLQR